MMKWEFSLVKDFHEFALRDGRSDQQTDRPTDRVTYRVACTQLKVEFCNLRNFRNLLELS